MKKALIVVDFQNDFITGALGFKKAQALRPVIREKIMRALSDGTDVIFTLDTHCVDYLQTVEGKAIPIEHCIRGSQGWELDDSVQEFVKSAFRIVEKPVFGSFELALLVKEQGYTDVELCGLVTGYCVLANALIVRSALPQCNITVDPDATDDSDEQRKFRAMETMRSFMIKVGK